MVRRSLIAPRSVFCPEFLLYFAFNPEELHNTHARLTSRALPTVTNRVEVYEVIERTNRSAELGIRNSVLPRQIRQYGKYLRRRKVVVDRNIESALVVNERQQIFIEFPTTKFHCTSVTLW
jgi:hypothetical protein